MIDLSWQALFLFTLAWIMLQAGPFFNGMNVEKQL
jgi:hypothetical protein